MSASAPVYPLSCSDPAYPQPFLKLPQPPDPLWVQGELPPPGTPIVGIVGTRQASEWGKGAAKTFARELARAGVWVVSGLARGIDTAAHLGAKEKTIAIIGSGLDHIYPAENHALAQEIVLLSAYSPATPPHAWNFPKRNVLVAALADVLLVIEAPEKSGALITAKEAHKLQKKCFALAGPYTHENFKGSNRLIKENVAELCMGVDDILTFLNRKPTPLPSPPDITQPTTPEELKIVMLLHKEDLSFDQLHMLTGFNASVLNVNLMNLVLKKAIREYPGRVYGKTVNYR